MPPVPSPDMEEPLVVNESSPLMDQHKRLGEFAGRRHVFFSFMDASEREDGMHVYDTPLWRGLHAGAFCLGGIFFLIGTLLYYPVMYLTYLQEDGVVDDMLVWIGWLYTIGSCGFLFVDVQEFFTFTDDLTLRINISCSAFGSTLYIIGSAGFLPSIWALTPYIGLYGFLGGSLAIGCSQTWKLYRILSTHSYPYKSSTINAALVEGGAMIGGFCFLIGTSMFYHGPVEGDVGCEVTCFNYNALMFLWSMGSSFFTLGGLSLAYRHAVMKLT